MLLSKETSLFMLMIFHRWLIHPGVKESWLATLLLPCPWARPASQHTQYYRTKHLSLFFSVENLRRITGLVWYINKKIGKHMIYWTWQLSYNSYLFEWLCTWEMIYCKLNILIMCITLKWWIMKCIFPWYLGYCNLKQSFATWLLLYTVSYNI